MLNSEHLTGRLDRATPTGSTKTLGAPLRVRGIEDGVLMIRLRVGKAMVPVAPSSLFYFPHLYSASPILANAFSPKMADSWV